MPLHFEGPPKGFSGLCLSGMRRQDASLHAHGIGNAFPPVPLRPFAVLFGLKRFSSALISERPVLKCNPNDQRLEGFELAFSVFLPFTNPKFLLVLRKFPFLLPSAIPCDLCVLCGWLLVFSVFLYGLCTAIHKILLVPRRILSLPRTSFLCVPPCPLWFCS